MGTDERNRLEAAGLEVRSPGDSVHQLCLIRCQACGQDWTWPVGRPVTEEAMHQLLDHMEEHRSQEWQRERQREQERQ